MSLTRAIGSGVAGAMAVTLLNESARRVIPHAPRMDVIGMRAIRRPMEALGYAPPPSRELRKIALGGDLVANSLFYALIGAGAGRHAWRRGWILGLSAGLGAAFLPPVMGLGNQPHRRTPYTQLLTIAWYLSAGLVGAAVAQTLE